MSYPVTVVGPPPARRRRATAFFRGVLATPHFVYLGCWVIVIACIAIGAWCSIVFAGRNSDGSQVSLVQGVSYIAHADAYLICLTETKPSQCEDSIPALGSSAAA